MSPYAILGIPENSTLEAVKAAYRSLAKQHHPDRNNSDPNASQRFMEVQAAYDAIMNPPKPQPPRFNFTSVMETIVELTVEEAFSGISRSLTLHSPFGGSIDINISVPPMTLHGTRLKVGGLPEQFNSFDLYLIILLNDRGDFSAMGSKVIRRVQIDFTVAILGGEVEITTLDGKRFFNVPAGANNGTMIKLPGLGFPLHPANPTIRDDFVVIVEVTLPAKINAKQKKLLEDFRKA